MTNAILGRVDEVTLAAYESILERDWDRL